MFIPAEDQSGQASIQDLAEGKFMVGNPEGVLVSPPGLGLLSQIEKRMSVDFTKMSMEELCEVMPRFILDDLNLAMEMELTPSDDQVGLRLVDSVYKGLYGGENDLKSVTLLGCPIASAVACAVAKTSGRPVFIQDHGITVEGSTVRVLYQIVKG